MSSHSESNATALTERGITTGEYAGIASFEDAIALLEQHGATILDSAELGDGFSVIAKDEKNRLIGVPFVIMQAVQTEGDHGTFVSLRIVTKNGEKLVLNDGSTGICEQLITLWEQKPETKGKPFLCRHGLRVSEYDHPQYGPSKTYYLDTSA